MPDVESAAVAETIIERRFAPTRLGIVVGLREQSQRVARMRRKRNARALLCRKAKIAAKPSETQR
jgi:hypothetical protein